MAKYITSHWFLRLFFRNLVEYEENATQLAQRILTTVRQSRTNKEYAPNSSDDLITILQKTYDELIQTSVPPSQEEAAIQLIQEIAQKVSQFDKVLEIKATSDLHEMLQQLRDQIIHVLESCQSTGELPTSVKSLIKLRDWSLLAQDNLEADTKSLMESLYRKLGDMLDDEGVRSLDEGGKFDFEVQRVVDTRSTKDETLIDTIYATVRPGYMYRGKRIRSQDVIIYTHS